MPSFGFDKALDKARTIKASLKPQSSIPRDAASDVGDQHGENQDENSKDARELVDKYREKLRRKRKTLQQVQKDRRATKDQAELVTYRRRRKKLQQEIFRLESKLRAAENGIVGKPVTGSLPDFVIIGARKAGTTFLYNLLVRHPQVRPAAVKEVHYFDNLIEEEDVKWYRRCFPAQQYEGGQRTITGEATPEYIAHPLVPERMAQVVPGVRLIALLRDPVERAYSDYQHVVRKGQESHTFEEALGLEEAVIEEKEPRLFSKPFSKGNDGPNRLDGRRGYLYRSIYVDQLLRWSKFFGADQMLVLKSEDLFYHTSKTVKPILNFLDLPQWEPKSWSEAPKQRNKGNYKEQMHLATRQKLERFFEPHNRRLYEFLGKDLEW